MSKQRIAVLGGGVGAMSAVWALTSEPDWQDRYDITVHTLGWRLGGKGASGRNQEHGQRIEEHGLHIWMGFYDNAFKMMQDCYAELGRPAASPVRTWTDAFRPHTNMVLYEFENGSWQKWALDTPIVPGHPGDGREWHAAPALLERFVGWFLDFVTGPQHEASFMAMFDRWHETDRPGWFARVRAAEQRVAVRLDHLEALVAGGHVPHLAWLVEDLHAAHEHLKRIAGGEAANHNDLVDAIGRFRERLDQLAESFIETHPTIRRLWTLADLTFAVIRGAVADGVMVKGFEAIEHLDFREWLKRHGASTRTQSSSVVRSMYDLCFAYEGGDLDRPNMAAGTFLRTVLEMGLLYKGAFMYRMTAGMGDIVFGPLYEVLQRRGVRFEFFRRVRALRTSNDGAMIERIEFDQQVRLKSGVDSYQPLSDVKGLPCWPSVPRFEQLEDGEKLAASGENLESHWCQWPATPFQLERGTDFDLVLLGISVGALSEIAADLCARSPAWQAMCDQVQTVETQAVQLWLKKPLSDLGWVGPPTVAGTYAEPLDTWADMSDLLEREDWDVRSPPESILYLCGPLREHSPAARTDAIYPRVRWAQTREAARTWLQSHLGVSFPKAAGTHNPSGLDFVWLHAEDLPADPLDRQYIRTNIDPSERYVLSVAGSASARLRADHSGYDNLFLAGDWVWTPINAGCVEAAAMAGLAAGRAICGYPNVIYGWPASDLPASRPQANGDTK